MKKTLVALLLLASLPATAEDTFLRHGEQFSTIQDSNTQGKSWAMCSAAFYKFAQLNAKQSPARSKRSHMLGNGAKLSILMSSVYIDFLKNPDSDSWSDAQMVNKFNTIYFTGKHSMDALYEIAENEIDVALENMGINQFIVKLSNTVLACGKNGELQQVYVDLWRNLVKEGWIK